MKALLHIIIVILLTLITQIGGIVWIITFGFFKWKNQPIARWKKVLFFTALYSVSTFLVVPPLARMCGRVPLPITKSANLIPHTYITPLLNRHYVKPTLLADLSKIADDLHAKKTNLKVSYLDANFPFIDGFPLLPHLSHNDGRKVDLSFYYTHDGQEGNLKPTTTGYGQFVEPLAAEHNQTKECKSNGYWQYDYAKFLTLGSREDLVFDQSNTKGLLQELINSNTTQKIFIEPHLKNRMKLISNKVRFHGCQAVRHDDHIHWQIR